MNEPAEYTSAFTAQAADEGRIYTPHLSAWAPVALLAGLASPVALFGPMLWSVAGAALVICVLVLIYLNHHRDSLSGRGVATFGLALALMFVVAGPTRHLLRLYNIAQQSAEVGNQWLLYLVRHEPYNAYETMRAVSMRRNLSPQLEALYSIDPGEAAAYENFLNSPVIKTIGNLPRGVQVRHYMTEDIQPVDSQTQIISDVFAVSWYENEKDLHSMLVRLELERRVDAAEVGGLWRILKYELVTSPSGRPDESASASRSLR